jgi:hypothetical protein
LGATFHKRKKYVTHYTNLILYLKLGMELTKVRKVLAFTQSTFLKSYIDHCTLLRQQSNTEFGKRLWKLFANAVFGKFIEQTRNYIDCKICVDETPCRKWISNPRFKDLKIISDDLVLVFIKRATVTLNKPLAIGFTILEKSKHFMYQQYYEVIKPSLGNCEVLMSDTDSFVLAIETKGKKNNLRKIKHIIDFSNYPSDSKYYNDDNKNELGFWKDELQGKTIREFCGLRSKTYAFLISDKDNKVILQSKCKGITKSYRKKIEFSSYKKCVKSFDKVCVTQFQIRSKNHAVVTAKVRKLAFSSFDDKRFLLSCGVHSLGYGSCLIEKNMKTCSRCKKCNPLQ